jgi:DNA anti-recombination protein RmuC
MPTIDQVARLDKRIDYVTNEVIAEFDGKLAKAATKQAQALKETENNILSQVNEAHKGVIERFDKIDERFEKIDERFEKIEKRFEKIENWFDGMGKRFDAMEKRFVGMDKRFDQVLTIVTKLEAKLL